jgi:hypothetical protein
MCFKYTGDSADDDGMAQEKVQTLLTDRQAKNSLSIISQQYPAIQTIKLPEGGAGYLVKCNGCGSFIHRMLVRGDVRCQVCLADKRAARRHA